MGEVSSEHENLCQTPRACGQDEYRLTQTETTSSANAERLTRMEQSVADTQIVVHRIEDHLYGIAGAR